MKAAEMFSLKGRVALVTGASSGLGIQFAKALADNGAAVALVARRADRLLDVQKAIEDAGGRAMAIEADVTDRAAMARAFDAAEKAFGTVTILINNAGVAHGGRAVEMPPEEWRRVLSTNLDAVELEQRRGDDRHHDADDLEGVHDEAEQEHRQHHHQHRPGHAAR